MIFARRLIALLLGSFFFAVLLAALLVLRLNGTFLNPEFYPRQLEEIGVYRFVMTDVLTSALDDVRAIPADELGVDLSGNPLEVSGLTTAQITETVNRALPPRDLQRIAAPAILRAGQYVSAERDVVTVRVKGAEHIRGVAGELHNLMQEAGAYDRILEKEVEPRIQRATDEAIGRNEQASGWMRNLFGGDQAARSRFSRAVANTLTPEWESEQVEESLGPLTSYLIGESDAFEITLRLTDAQMAAASDEIAAILREVDTYDLVYKGVVEPVVKDALGPEIDLPYSLVVTDDEVMDALSRSALPNLVQQQAESLAHGISPYVSGRSDEFSIDVSLVRNKQEAAAVLTELVGAKMVEAFSDLPVCATAAQARDAAGRLRREVLPPCVPPGVTGRTVLEQDVPAIEGLVQAQILTPVPNIITFSESDLRVALLEEGGPEVLAHFDQLRELPSRSWSYNHEHLRADLAGRGNALRVLDRTRSFLADGYTLSNRTRAKGRLGRRVDAALDAVRGLFGIVRRYQWAAYLTAPALLVAVGLLGGTTWRGRVMWASATLLISSTLVLILAWPVYDVVAGKAVAHWRGNMVGSLEGPFEGTYLLIAEWLVGKIRVVANEFMSGIKAYSLVLSTLSLAVLLGTIFWDRITAVARKKPFMEEL